MGYRARNDGGPTEFVVDAEADLATITNPRVDQFALAHTEGTIWFHTGTVWQQITGGAGGGNVATDVIWDAKGDLAVGTGANTAVKFPVGTDKQFIVADSSTATGLLWTFSLKIPTSGVTAPIYLDFDNTYTDRKADLTVRGDTNGVPTNVRPMVHLLARGKGDNATFIGTAAIYAQVRDRSDVTGANKGVLYGLQLDVNPLVARNNVPFDDADGVVVTNSNAAGDSKATDAFYIAHNSAYGTNREFITGYQVDGNVDYAFFTGSGRNFTSGLELRGSFSSTAINVVTKANSVFANAALATTATDGFVYVPTCAGVPTGVPTAFAGTTPLAYDTTNNRLYIYNSGWKGVELAS